MCTALVVEVAEPGDTTHNGVYNKQATMIDGLSWYVARHDVPDLTPKSLEDRASLYYSNVHKRWTIEASTVTFEMTDEVTQPRDQSVPELALTTIASDWTQLQQGASKHVTINIQCFGTAVPSEEPTGHPTEQPTNLSRAFRTHQTSD